MTSKEITQILIEVEKRVRKGPVFGVVELPNNTLGVNKIFYNQMKNGPAVVSLVSNDFRIDLKWSRLNKIQQQEILNILEKL